MDFPPQIPSHLLHFPDNNSISLFLHPHPHLYYHKIPFNSLFLEPAPDPPTYPSNMSPPPEPKDKSNYQLLKEGGYDNMHRFMLSYGLKPYNDEDYQEAKLILDSLRECEQEDWEEQYGKQHGEEHGK